MKKILDVNNLNITFDTFAGPVSAVRGVSFTLHEGETLAIVGESGSGKSVASKAIMGILAENGRITDGSITYIKENGEEIDLAKLSERNYHQIRGKEVAMVFQDPMTSLNPTMTIGRQIMEPIMKHQGCTKAEAKVKAEELITLVGISQAEKRMKQYPHQFSGPMPYPEYLYLFQNLQP